MSKLVLSFGGVCFSSDIELFDTITFDEATKLSSVKGVVAPVNDILSVVKRSGNYDITIKSKKLIKG